MYYVKNKEKISQRKKEWYLRKKAERLAMEKSEKGKREEKTGPFQKKN